MRARSLKRLAPLLLAALAQSACTSAREQQLPGDYVDDAAQFVAPAVWQRLIHKLCQRAR